MATTPLVVTTEQIQQSTQIADDAVQAMKASAVDTLGIPIDPSTAIDKFDDPSSDISGVQKLVKAIALGSSKNIGGTDQSTPNTVVKRDAEGDFSAREITTQKIIFGDNSSLTSAASLSNLDNFHFEGGLGAKSSSGVWSKLYFSTSRYSNLSILTIDNSSTPTDPTIFEVSQNAVFHFDVSVLVDSTTQANTVYLAIGTWDGTQITPIKYLNIQYKVGGSDSVHTQGSIELNLVANTQYCFGFYQDSGVDWTHNDSASWWWVSGHRVPN